VRHFMPMALLAASLCLLTGIGGAAAQEGQAVSAKHQFVQGLSLRGTLGSSKVQVDLRTKEEFEDGIEGGYFLFGQSHTILLAGEIEGDELFLEESVNGKDVSGQWNGKMTGDTITGEWQSVDGMTHKPFSLRIVLLATPKKASERTARVGQHK